MKKHPLIDKLVTIVLVAAVLWCASLVILSLIRERKKHRMFAVNVITRPWGGNQILTAPFLTIPYKPVSDNGDGEESLWRHVYVLPEKLDISCVVNPEKQRQNLFQAVVYSSRIHISGHFSLPDWRQLGLDQADLWRAEPSAAASSRYKAYFTLGSSSERGLKSPSNVLINSLPLPPSGVRFHDLPFASKATGVKTSGVEIELSPDNQNISFSFDLELTGSETLMFSPLGKNNSIFMRSNWTQPRLIGQYPPEQLEQSKNGFSVRWSIDGDDYPRSFSAGNGIVAVRGGINQSLATLSGVGIRFFDALDDHRKIERVTKYAAVFILFTFAAFFIAEVKNRTLVHPIQYLMVGGGIVIFYLLLLSICEHADFAIAYLLSSLATVAIITLYAWAALRNRPFAASAGGLLLSLYGYFYITTQMEDYALLAGSLALFIILAALMYFTREIDWYRLEDTPD